MVKQDKSNLHQPVWGGGVPTTHKWCDTCMFCEVIDPIGRQPQTRYCKIYGPKDTHGKPDEVIYQGARCEFYEKEQLNERF